MATRREEPGPGAPRRRILVCTPFPPRLDARHGGKAPAQLLFRLARRNEVAVLCLRAHDEGPVDPAIAEHCTYVEEIPLRETKQARADWRRRARWTLGLARGLPPWATDCRSEAYASRLRSLVADWRPDVVELHLQVMAQYVSALAESPAARILVDYDPASAWAADLLRRAKGPQRLARGVEVAAWRRYERATRPLFQAIVVFAEFDVAAVAPTAGGTPVIRIPLAIEVPATALDPVGSLPPTVLFVGGFRHHPNVDAAIWLSGIFPRVLEQVPDARLDLVGNKPAEEVRRLAADAVTVHGSVPDVTPFLDRAAVVAAPIRIGGSMRMKVLEALAAGKALVATPRAAEGVEAVPGEHFLLARSEQELIDMLVEILLDPSRRRELATRARAWAADNLGWERSVVAFERLYDSLIAAS
jgi:polysaccharide biosynthesis protein PslH